MDYSVSVGSQSRSFHFPKCSYHLRIPASTQSSWRTKRSKYSRGQTRRKHVGGGLRISRYWITNDFIILRNIYWQRTYYRSSLIRQKLTFFYTQCDSYCTFALVLVNIQKKPALVADKEISEINTNLYFSAPYMIYHVYNNLYWFIYLFVCVLCAIFVLKNLKN